MVADHQRAEVEAESEVPALQESASVSASLDDKLPDASSPLRRRPSKLNQTTRASSLEITNEEFGRTISGYFGSSLFFFQCLVHQFQVIICYDLLSNVEFS